DRQDTGTAPSDTYLASGNPASEDVGAIYYDADPTTLPWASQGFVADATCDRSTPRLIGVGVGRTTMSSNPTLYAATDGCGFYRLLSGGTWTRVDGSAQMYRIKDGGFTYAPVSFP